MAAMGKLSYQNRLQVRTTPVVLEGLTVSLARQHRIGHKFDGRKIGLEALVGCVLLDYLSRPNVDQDAVVQRWLETLELQATGESVREESVSGAVEVPAYEIKPKKASRKRG